MAPPIRRLIFTLGAVLLAGGWGGAGFVETHQLSAGGRAAEWWRNGVQTTEVTVRPVETRPRSRPLVAPWEPGYGEAAAEAPPQEVLVAPTVEQVFQLLESAGFDSDGESSASSGRRVPVATTNRTMLPSMWLYLISVAAMTAGAALMALTVPWRGLDPRRHARSSEHAGSPLRFDRAL